MILKPRASLLALALVALGATASALPVDAAERGAARSNAVDEHLTSSGDFGAGGGNPIGTPRALELARPLQPRQEAGGGGGSGGNDPGNGHHRRHPELDASLDARFGREGGSIISPLAEEQGSPLHGRFSWDGGSIISPSTKEQGAPLHGRFSWDGGPIINPVAVSQGTPRHVRSEPNGRSNSNAVEEAAKGTIIQIANELNDLVHGRRSSYDPSRRFGPEGGNPIGPVEFTHAVETSNKDTGHTRRFGAGGGNPIGSGAGTSQSGKHGRRAGRGSAQPLVGQVVD